MKKIFFAVLIFCTSIACTPAWPEQNASDAASVYAFAEWLYQEGEFNRAAGEYMRFLFLSRDRDQVAILFKIGLCYKYANNYGKAITIFNKLLPITMDDAQKQAIFYELAYCFFQLELYRDSLAVTLQGNGDKLLLLETAAYLCLKEWDAAVALNASYLDKIAAPYQETALELGDLAGSGRNYPQKSPIFAGILSAIIPGSGKMYAGRFMDGVVSLVTVGIFGGMAAYSFYEEGSGSVRGWIYAAVGGVFYLGNIYGSVTAANLYNREQEEIIIRKVREKVAAEFP